VSGTFLYWRPVAPRRRAIHAFLTLILHINTIVYPIRTTILIILISCSNFTETAAKMDAMEQDTASAAVPQADDASNNDKKASQQPKAKNQSNLRSQKNQNVSGPPNLNKTWIVSFLLAKSAFQSQNYEVSCLPKVVVRLVLSDSTCTMALNQVDGCILLKESLRL
jgi:hypothetical protein